jgi:hypothetical protein
MRTDTALWNYASGQPIEGVSSTTYAVTHTHATAALATKAAVTGAVHLIMGVSCSSDKAGAIVLVKDDTAVIWAGIVAANGNYIENFVGCPLIGTVSKPVSVTIDGTSLCKANVRGITLMPKT